MFVYLLKFLGVTPGGGKTGKREAAWTWIAITLGLTLIAVWLGEAMVQAMSPLLMLIWPTGGALLAAAYKLEHDKLNNAEQPGREEGHD